MSAVAAGTAAASPSEPATTAGYRHQANHDCPATDDDFHDRSMAAKKLDGGNIRLTIGGEGGNDFVATFTELGIDPEEMPVADIESDFFSLSMGSTLWTSADGIDWFESRGPEFSSTSPLGSQPALDANAAGLFVHGYGDVPGALSVWHSADAAGRGQVAQDLAHMAARRRLGRRINVGLVRDHRQREPFAIPGVEVSRFNEDGPYEEVITFGPFEYEEVHRRVRDGN